MEDIDLPLKRGSLNDIEKSQAGSSHDTDVHNSRQDAMEVDDSSQVCFLFYFHICVICTFFGNNLENYGNQMLQCLAGKELDRNKLSPGESTVISSTRHFLDFFFTNFY